MALTPEFRCHESSPESKLQPSGDEFNDDSADYLRLIQPPTGCGCVSSLTNEQNPLMQCTRLIFHEKLMCSVPSRSLACLKKKKTLNACWSEESGREKKNNHLVNNNTFFFFRLTERWVFGQKRSTKMKKVPALRLESRLVHMLDWLISYSLQIGVFYQAAWMFQKL